MCGSTCLTDLPFHRHDDPDLEGGDGGPVVDLNDGLAEVHDVGFVLDIVDILNDHDVGHFYRVALNSEFYRVTFLVFSWLEYQPDF